MSTPEMAKLKILAGNIYTEDKAIIYEVDSTHQRTLLPLESHEVLELLVETDRSISELVSELKKRNGNRVSYQNLFFTVEKLLKEEIVFPADAGVRPYFDDSRIKLVNSLTTDIVVFPRKSPNHRVRLPFFYILVFAVIVGGLEGIWHLVSADVTPDFLLVRGRYDSGFFFALAFFSILMSLKTLILASLNILACGRAYDIAVRITPLSCALRFDDTFLYASTRKSVSIFYFLASVLAYFLIAGLAKNYFLSDATAPQVLTLALLLTLLDINPLGNGELKKVGFNFFSTSKRDIANVAYSLIVTGWCLLTMSILLYLAYENAPSLVDQLEADDTAQRTGAGIVLVILLIPFVYIGTELVKAFIKNLTSLRYRFVNQVKHKFGRKVLKKLDRKGLRELIGATPFFAAVNDHVLDALIENGTVVSYKTGTPIVQQGSSSTDICVILSGTVQIQKRDDSGFTRHLTDMDAGCTFGEMSAYGLEERTADVIAKKSVLAFVIRAELVRELSSTADFQIQMQPLMDRILVTQYFLSQQFFSSLPVELIQVFYSGGGIEEHEANKIVIQQGEQRADLYLILKGSALVEVNGKTLNTLNQGEFFGELAMLQHLQGTASIRTASKTTLLRIPPHVFWKLALNNPEIASSFEAVAEMPIEEIEAPPVQPIVETEAPSKPEGSGESVA